MLVARVIVDVYGYGAELGDFRLKGGEGVVVLSEEEVSVREVR